MVFFVQRVYLRISGIRSESNFRSTRFKMELPRCKNKNGAVGHAIKIIESGLQLDVIYTDFQKAFDSASHSILIKKLITLGMDVNLVKWIKSYHNDRYQYVKLLSHESRNSAVKSGFPQGSHSHLRSLLFILFIAGVTLQIGETVVCGRLESCADAIQLQSNLDRCKLNKLDLNIDQCQAMTLKKYRLAVWNMIS